MSARYDGLILDHLAEHMLYLSTDPSFWFSLNLSYDHDCHLSKRFGMMPLDYGCCLRWGLLALLNLLYHKMHSMIHRRLIIIVLTLSSCRHLIVVPLSSLPCRPRRCCYLVIIVVR